MRILQVLIIFLLIGAFFIVSENNLALKNEDERLEFGRMYSKWVANVIDNGKEITGYVVKMNWLPDNNEDVFD